MVNTYKKDAIITLLKLVKNPVAEAGYSYQGLLPDQDGLTIRGQLYAGPRRRIPYLVHRNF